MNKFVAFIKSVDFVESDGFCDCISSDDCMINETPAGVQLYFPNNVRYFVPWSNVKYLTQKVESA